MSKRASDAVRALDFAQLRREQYLCELVVEAGGGTTSTIGGNVGDAVALTALPVDEQGLLTDRPAATLGGGAGQPRA